MNRSEGFLLLGARLGYWLALCAAGFVGAVVILGRIAHAIGSVM